MPPDVYNTSDQPGPKPSDDDSTFQHDVGVGAEAIAGVAARWFEREL